MYTHIGIVCRPVRVRGSAKDQIWAKPGRRRQKQALTQVFFKR